MKGALEATSGKLGQAASSSNHSLSWWCIRTSFPTKSTQITSTAQCVLCSVYFSAQPNKLRPILNNWVLVSQWTNTCPSLFECAENIFFSHFCDFQTLDPWFPLKYTLSPYCIGYRVIKDTGASYWTKYTLCTGAGFRVTNESDISKCTINWYSRVFLVLQWDQQCPS